MYQLKINGIAAVIPLIFVKYFTDKLNRIHEITRSYWRPYEYFIPKTYHFVFNDYFQFSMLIYQFAEYQKLGMIIKRCPKHFFQQIDYDKKYGCFVPYQIPIELQTQFKETNRNQSYFIPPISKENLLKFTHPKVDHRYHQIMYEALHNTTHDRQYTGSECHRYNCVYYFKHAREFLHWVKTTSS
jgi:hypothetical protein